MSHKITITISGEVCTGKSCIAREIVAALEACGFDVTNDDIDAAMPITPAHHNAILTGLVTREDAPVISVVTQNLQYMPQVIETTDTADSV